MEVINSDEFVIMKVAHIDNLEFKGGRKRLHARFHTSLYIRVRMQVNGSHCRIQVMSDGVLLQDSLGASKDRRRIVFHRTPRAFAQRFSIYMGRRRRRRT